MFNKIDNVSTLTKKGGNGCSFWHFGVSDFLEYRKMCDKNIKMFDILNGNWFSEFQMNGAKITFCAIWVFQ